MSYPPVEGSPQYYLDYEYILMIFSLFWFGAGVITVLVISKLVSWRRTRLIVR